MPSWEIHRAEAARFTARAAILRHRGDNADTHETWVRREREARAYEMRASYHNSEADRLEGRDRMSVLLDAFKS